MLFIRASQNRTYWLRGYRLSQISIILSHDATKGAPIKGGVRTFGGLKVVRGWTTTIYCREPSAEGLRKYDGVRTVQWNHVEHVLGVFDP